MTFDDLQVSDLAWIRAIAGLTQAQAAERLGISKSHYAGIEAGSYAGDKVMLNVGKLLNEEFDRVHSISNSQLYKQAGNSIVVNVLSALLSQLFYKELL